MPRTGRGVLLTITDEWRIKAKAALKEKGISQAELAREIGVSKSALTKFFRLKRSKAPTQKQSGFAEHVAKRSGVPLPGQILPTTKEAVDIIDELSADPFFLDQAMVTLRAVQESRREAIRRALHASQSVSTPNKIPRPNDLQPEAVDAIDGGETPPQSPDDRRPASKPRR